MNPLIDHRFIIVAGKGGVGKSTVAMALALASARAGRRTLLYQYAGSEGRQTPFSTTTIRDEITQLAPNLFSVCPSTEAGIREYVMLKLKSKTAYRVVFQNAFIKRLLDGIPAVNELIWLGKAFNHEREVDKKGRPVWDTIVLDPPATGHSLYLFQVPFVVRQAVPTGPFFKEADKMARLLQDASRTALHLVTLPEEMPVNECFQLKASIEESVKIPIRSLIVNAVFPRIFEEEAEALLALREVIETDGGVIDRLVEAARFRIERSKLQCGYLQRLKKELALPTLEIPYYFSSAVDRKVLENMAHRILSMGDPDLVQLPLACPVVPPFSGGEEG